MARRPRRPWNSRPAQASVQWTEAQDAQLQILAEELVPVRVIARVLGRSEQAVRHRARKKGVTLLITRQRPKQ